MDRENSKNIKNVLKFAFMGITHLIPYDAQNQKYKEFIKSVLRAFDIPADYKRALILKNARGDIFDKTTLINYIRYFPNPNNIIFIRIDYANVRTHTVKYKHLKKKESNSAPLRRQNCFLGRLPVEHTVVAACMDSPPEPKRRRLLIHSKKPKEPKPILFRI